LELCFFEERFELIFLHEDVYKDVHEEDLGEGLLLQKKQFFPIPEYSFVSNGVNMHQSSSSEKIDENSRTCDDALLKL
jgi:hypothetical protein